MARVHGANGRVYVDQYNLSGRTNQWDLELGQGLEEVTAFEDTAETFVTALQRRSWGGKLSAFADYTDDEIDEILHAIINDTNHHVGFYSGGALAGAPGFEGIGVVGRKQNANAMGPARLGLDFTGRGGQFMSRAMKLNEATVVTGIGNQTGQTHMATVAADRVICVVRITGVTGAGSVTFKLQESSDDAVGDPYADVITMTAMTAVGSQLQAVVAGGVLGPYYRLTCSAFSGFTNVTVRASVGIIKGG